jgi:exodeoxyribonuclease-5
MVKDYYNNDWLNLTKELINKGLANNNELEAFEEMVNSPDKENKTLAKEIIRLRIEDAYLKELNKEQQKAFVKLISYLKNPEEYKAAVLQGYAGTGKTYLISHVVDFIRKAYPNRKVAVTAPTNKAVKVLSNGKQFQESGVFKTKHGSYDHVAYGTVHSILGLKEEIISTGERKFVVDKKKSRINEFRYLIVDEASMLDDELYGLIMKNKGNKLDVIFMGDPAQIPPVKQEQCLPFRDDNPDLMLKLQLTKIMRQKANNPIIKHSLTLRQNLSINNPLGTIESKTVNNTGVTVLNSIIDKPKMRGLLKKLYTDSRFKINSDFVKTIAWRNKSITYLNNVIREELYGSTKERFVINDHLVSNAALFSKKITSRGLFNKMICNTSTEFIIKKVDIKPIAFKEFKKNKSIPSIEFKCEAYRLLTNTYDEDNEHIVINVITEKYMSEYNKILKDLKHKAISSKNVDNWVIYYEACKWSHDVSYNYAITAHKSQGSTYNNVVFIEEDVDNNFKIVERNRIKYTAYTRASDNLYLLRKN